MWEQKIKDYCNNYNILVNYLPEVLQDPKVIPMIRGKAFEFSILVSLRCILNADEWKVEKLIINAQSGLQDQDLTITHIKTGKTLTVECKLSANKKPQKMANQERFKIQVKCMRSRTLGEEKVKELAPVIGVSETVLKVHNDQYRPGDFDLVVTSIGNAFYTTDPLTKNYIWNPNKEATEFLNSLNTDPILDLTNPENLRDFAFNKIYIAKASDLAINPSNALTCTRRKCENKKNCGFIPNYPVIYFDLTTGKVLKPWVELENCSTLLESLL